MHTRKILAVGITVLVLLASLASYFPAAATGLEEKEDELLKVRQEMDAQKSLVNEARQKVNSISEKLKEIQIDLEEATKGYQATVNKLELVEQQIIANKQMLAVVEKNLADRIKILSKRMRDIYAHGQINYLDVLLGSANFTDFANRAHLLKRVVNQDVSLVNQIRAEQNIVIQKKSDLEHDYILLAQLKEDADAKKALVELRKKNQEELLASAVDEREVAEKTYEELMATSREIENMIRRAKSGPGDAKGSGVLIWPVSSTYITSPYGWRTHPIFGSSRYHSGVDIGASYGDEVSAADSGTVISSGWMGGYGKTVIIDHGGGISTLYAHNSELLVGEGYQVRKGQAIAYVGATGYATGPHLHFEVRKNGSTVDPMSYF